MRLRAVKDGAVLFLTLSTFTQGEEYHLSAEYDVTKVHLS